MPPRPAPAPTQAQIAQHLQQGLQLHQQGRLDAARAIYDQVLAVAPRHGDALHLRGVVALQQGQAGLAVERIRAALKVDAKQPGYWYNLGNALMAHGQPADAVGAFEQALTRAPDFLDAAVNLGNALAAAGQPQQALLRYAQVLARDPGQVQAWLNQGNALFELRHWQQALDSFDRALALQPGLPLAHAGRGHVLFRLGSLEDALQSYDQALALLPDHPETLSNRANVLMALRRLDEAQAGYEAAIALTPQYAEAHFNLSLLHLLRGRFEPGWAMYEWRWRRRGPGLQAPDIAAPRWTGEQDLADRTLWVYAEQGLGDTLQFVRYVPRLKARGARVLLTVQDSLRALLQQLEGVDEWLSPGVVPQGVDFHCPLLSLPLAFGTGCGPAPADSPACAAYLQASPSLIEHWAARLGPRQRPRWGLVWSGNPQHQHDLRRSLSFEALWRALPPGIDYVCLQKEVREQDAHALTTPGLLALGDEIRDFADTAALCALMDGVITVDTSVAHLAGALGCPTHLLLPHVPDWRWQLDRTDSPWYPSLHLYRQGPDRQWEGPLQRLATAVSSA